MKTASSSVIKHPAIRYHGAKFRLAPWLISHFPSHRCYVEPFGGAAGVMLRKERSYSEVYNDLDGEIVNFFCVLRDPLQREKLIELCILTPYSRTEFFKAYEPAADDIERARRLVVRAHMGFGSAAACGWRTGFRSDTKRNCATVQHMWMRLPENLAAVGQRFSGVLIENKNALEVIKQHDAETTLFNVDPPYVPQSRSGSQYYRHEMTILHHAELLQTLRSCAGAVVLSGYDSEFYNDELNGWRKETKTSAASGRGGSISKKECIWIKQAQTK